jgi:hypothetical protein
MRSTDAGDAFVDASGAPLSPTGHAWVTDAPSIFIDILTLRAE